MQAKILQNHKTSGSTQNNAAQQRILSFEIYLIICVYMKTNGIKFEVSVTYSSSFNQSMEYTNCGVMGMRKFTLKIF